MGQLAHAFGLSQLQFSNGTVPTSGRPAGALLEEVNSILEAGSAILL